MPYITQESRNELLEGNTLLRSPKTSGELNYLLTRLCLEYIQANGDHYQQFNDVLGALEGAKLEFYRRSIAEYENGKISENGDVY